MTAPAPRRRPRGREALRARRGFTLLEVMVALAILAGGLLALSDVVTGALRNHVRARQLDVATLLARGRLAAVEDQYERDGFRDFDQEEEGTFEDEGHPEVRWKLGVRRPAVELGPDAVLRALTGSEKGLQELLPSATAAPGLAPAAGLLGPVLQTTLTKIGEDLKKGVREARLTVSWKDGGATESFDVTTYLVVMQATGGVQTVQPAATPAGTQQQGAQLPGAAPQAGGQR